MSKESRSRRKKSGPGSGDLRMPSAKVGDAGGPGIWPSLSQISDPRGPYLISLIILFIPRIWFWLRLPNANEDAYITYRYARNLVDGLGLVYNPGERVLGFSSPLWTLWSALGILLTQNPVAWTRAWSLAADICTLLCMGKLLVRHASRASALCFTLFFSGWVYFSAMVTSGMENSALFALMVMSAALVETRSRVAGPSLAAVALMRPEGVAAAAILSLTARARDRLAALGIAGLGYAALAGYFGTIVPQSAIAKFNIYGAPGPWEGRLWWEWLSPFALGRWPKMPEFSQLFHLSVLFGPAAAVGSAILWRARRTALALLVAAALIVWAGYSVFGVAYFAWYFLVPLGGLVALASVGLPAILRGRAVYVGVVLFIAGSWTVFPRLYLGRAAHENLGFADAARVIYGHMHPGEKVMLEPIGMIGWATRLEVIDEVGLVSPRVMNRRLQGPGWYADIAAREQPDWLVLRREVMVGEGVFAGIGAPFRSPAERDSLLSHYQSIQIVAEEAGGGALAVLHRFR